MDPLSQVLAEQKMITANSRTAFICSVLTIIIGCLMMYLVYPHLIADFWLWLIVPVFHVPPITAHQGLGLILAAMCWWCMRGFNIFQHQPKIEDPLKHIACEKAIQYLTKQLAQPIILLVFWFAIKLWF